MTRWAVVDTTLELTWATFASHDQAWAAVVDDCPIPFADIEVRAYQETDNDPTATPRR